VSYDYKLDGGGLDAPILFEMAKSGFVTMRIDKPGVGDSEGGPFAQVDFTTEADIYRQGLLALRRLQDVDTSQVFLFGHSMGGAFGPLVASEIPVRGIVVYGVVARTWHEYFLDIARYQTLLAGQSYSEVDENVRLTSRAEEMIFQDHMTASEAKKAHPELASTLDDLFPDGLFFGKTSAFWEQLEDTNFAALWERCNTHVLAVHGESDYVSYAVDHELIADIVNRAHPGWGRYASLPSSDHGFSNWPTEAESMQHASSGTFNPAFTALMKGWIDEVRKSAG
jgi:pimeloyl-ACP methyl ester carboxylesterase